MRRYTLLASVILAASTSAAFDVNVNLDNGNGRHVRFSQGAAGGTVRAYMNDGSAGSPLTMLGSGGTGASWMYTGRVPQTYVVLGLTDEQSAALQSLCEDARQEQQDASRKFYAGRKPGQRMDPEQMREQHRKFNEMREELADRYATRMRDVLTDEQRETLSKIEKVLEAWRGQETTIREVMGLALRQNRENHEEKLEELLTEEQLGALQKAHDNRANHWRGGKKRSGPQRQNPRKRPAEKTDPLETF